MEAGPRAGASVGDDEGLRRGPARWRVRTRGGLLGCASARTAPPSAAARCSLQVVVSRAGGITQGILITQEVVDGVRIASRHVHELSVPTHVTAVQALICFLFSFSIYSLCVPYWQQLSSFFSKFSFFSTMCFSREILLTQILEELY